MQGPLRADGENLTQRILSGARWATMLQMLGQAISWLSTILVVRFLTPQDYGLYAMLEAPLELLLLFGVLGLDAALVRAKRIEEAAVKAAFGMLLLVGAVFFAAFFFGAPLIADYYRQPELVAVARTLAVVFLLLPFRVIPNALLDRELQFKSRAKLELIAKVASAIATLSLAAFGAGMWSLVAGVLVDRVLYAVLVSVRHPWFVMPSLRWGAAQQLIAFGGLTTAASAILMITSKGVGVIAAPLLGAANLGIYSLATQFALLPLAKAMPVLNPLLIPAFARFHDDPGTAARHLEQAIRIASIVLVPIMIGLAAVSDAFVRLVFGPDWTAAALPLALMSCIMPLRMVTLFLRSVMTSLGRADLLLYTVLVPFLVVIPLSYFVAPHGTVALIVLWVSLEPLTLALTVLMSQRALPFGWSALMRSLRPSVLAALVMVAAILAAEAAGLHSWPVALRLAGGVAIGALSYMAILWAFFRPELLKAVSVITGR